MYCVACGAALQPGQRFCPGCGTLIEASSAGSPRSRLSEHLRLLAVFWFVVSGLRLLPGIFLRAMFNPANSFLSSDVPDFVYGIVRMIGWVLIGGAAMGLITGWGLLQRAPWARTLAIVLGCISLIDIPFGTALGIYTLWVLAPAQSEQEYRQISQAA